MAMNISKEGQDITKRFFQAIDILTKAKHFRGLQTFTKNYGLNRRNIQHIKESPSNTVLKPEILMLLVKHHNVSGTWLLTGEGPIFQDGTDEPVPAVWKNKPRAAQKNPVAVNTTTDKE